MKEAAVPCDDCVFRTNEIVFNVGEKANGRITPDGRLRFVKKDILGWVGGLTDLRTDQSQRLQVCEHSETRIERVPKSGILGKLGLKQDIEVKYCPAISEQEMLETVSEQRMGPIGAIFN